MIHRAGRGARPKLPGPVHVHPVLDLTLVLCCAALALWVHRLTLAAYFGPDDFIYLERALGLLPTPDALWRSIPGKVWFGFATPLFGPDPGPWFATNLGLHALNVGLVYVFMRQSGAAAAASTLAAGLFGASRLHVTTLTQAATVSELMVSAFVLASLVAARRAGWPWVVVSAALFGLALLCKESVVLMPLVLLVDRRLAPRARAVRASVLLAMGLAWGAWIASSDTRQFYAGGAYDFRIGGNVFHNLMTFADWSVDTGTTIPDLFGTYSDTAWKTGLWVLLVWGAVAALTWRAERLPAIGLAWWLAGLVPVLPLLYHSYLHYLYLPFAGLAMAVGGTLEWIEAAMRNRKAGTATVRSAAWLAAAAMVLGYAAVSDRLLRARATQRAIDLDVPFDPLLRKAEYARRTAEGIAGAVHDGHARVAFMVPPGPDRVFSDVIRATLDGGRGLRVIHATLDSVAFLERFTPADSSFELFAQSPDGRVQRLGHGPAAHLAWADRLTRSGEGDAAEQAVESAARAYPEDRRLRDRARRQP